MATEIGQVTPGNASKVDNATDDRPSRRERSFWDKGKWVFTLNVTYYIAPFVFSAFMAAVILYGHGWFMKVTSGFNWMNPFADKFTPDALQIVVMFRLCLIIMLYGLARLFVSLAIPPERTFQQNIDMVLALVPVVVVGYLLARNYFLVIPMGMIEWYTALFALIVAVVMDFFGARLAQRIISAYRRRIDIE